MKPTFKAFAAGYAVIGGLVATVQLLEMAHPHADFESLTPEMITMNSAVWPVFVLRNWRAERARTRIRRDFRTRRPIVVGERRPWWRWE